jgi:hypothetical protein
MHVAWCCVCTTLTSGATPHLPNGAAAAAAAVSPTHSQAPQCTLMQAMELGAV